jgi:uncharacterized membrane protein
MRFQEHQRVLMMIKMHLEEALTQLKAQSKGKRLLSWHEVLLSAAQVARNERKLQI